MNIHAQRVKAKAHELYLERFGAYWLTQGVKVNLYRGYSAINSHGNPVVGEPSLGIISDSLRSAVSLKPNHLLVTTYEDCGIQEKLFNDKGQAINYIRQKLHLPKVKTKLCLVSAELKQLVWYNTVLPVLFSSAITKLGCTCSLLGAVDDQAPSLLINCEGRFFCCYLDSLTTFVLCDVKPEILTKFNIKNTPQKKLFCRGSLDHILSKIKQIIHNA